MEGQQRYKTYRNQTAKQQRFSFLNSSYSKCKRIKFFYEKAEIGKMDQKIAPTTCCLQETHVRFKNYK